MCPCGLVRSGNFSHGNPVPATNPSFDSNPIPQTDKSWISNPIPPQDPTFNSNPVTWTPSPAHFGNVIGGGVLPTLPTPTFSPVAGSYSSIQSVTITSANSTAIYYTTDGSTPTTGSTLYTGAISVSTSETIKAIGVATGYSNSAVGSAAYTISLGYGAYKTVTIHKAQVPSNQTQFPVLFTGTYSYLADVAHGGSVTNANGYDIIFSSTNNPDGSGKIAFERVAWDNTTGQVTFYFPAALSSSADTVVYLLYGNSAVTTDQSNKTAVWDANFLQVNHLVEATGAQLMDSTSNGNNSTANTGSTQTTGYWGKALSVAAAGACNVTFPQLVTSGNMIATFSCWFKTGSGGSSPYKADLYNASAAGPQGPNFYVFNSTVFTLYAGGNNVGAIVEPVEDGAWHYGSVAVNFTLATQSSRLDGYTNTSSSGIGSSSGAWATGSLNGDSTSPILNIQELRISKIERSADWQTIEYNNMSVPSSFYAVA